MPQTCPKPARVLGASESLNDPRCSEVTDFECHGFDTSKLHLGNYSEPSPPVKCVCLPDN